MLTGVFSICQLSTCDVSTSVFSRGYPGLIIFLLTSRLPFSLNSRHTLRRAHTSSSDFVNLVLQQQSDVDVDVEFNVSSIILHVMVGKDAYASNFTITRTKTVLP
jgi:hypothetical protein